MSFESKAQKIREELSCYDTYSVIELLLQRLHHQPTTQSPAMQMAWVPCLALDWVLEIEPQVGAPAIKKEALDRIVNDIWRLQNNALPLKSASGIALPLRALFIPQLRFQRNSIENAFFMLRMSAIFNVNDKGKALKADFKRVTDVDFDEFMVFSLWLFFTFNKSRTSFLRYEQLLVQLYPRFTIEKIVKMLGIVGNTIPRLRKDIRLDRDVRRVVRREEYNSEPFTVNRPALILREGISTPHTQVLSLGVAELVMRTLKNDDAQKFRGKFTRAFERYIEAFLDEHSIPFLTERELEEIYNENGVSGKVVDFLINQGETNLFIDAKGVEPKPKALVTDSSRIIRDKIKDAHIKGIEQVAETIKLLESSSYEGLCEFDQRYGLIITHQDFYLGDGVDLSESLNPEHRSSLMEIVKSRIPLDNLFFCCIQDFEGIVDLCEEAETSLCEFLRYCGDMQRDPRARKFEMSQHIAEYSSMNSLSKSRPIGSKLVQESKDEIFENTLDMLEHNLEFWARGWQLTVPLLLSLRQKLFTSLTQKFGPP